MACRLVGKGIPDRGICKFKDPDGGGVRRGRGGRAMPGIWTNSRGAWVLEPRERALQRAGGELKQWEEDNLGFVGHCESFILR